MQRLFSTFPEGWPGAGLIFLRAVAAIPSVQHAIAGLLTATSPALIALRLVTMGAGALLLVGFWTPIAGVSMAIAEMCLAFLYANDPGTHILLGALGASLAMLGPVAWSADA